ncbi:MAG TPA: Gfo/Idh/MocA family oxidoreductase [Bryobacteraceae bacterium]|jgi:predicted dehydrogenase|nr:Gfo/Idh/MocA family oxidoreductase [Bryobacteraceae bacterium]
MYRRAFLAGAAAFAARKAVGANETLRIGLIGCGGRGRYVAGLMSQAPGIQFAAVCDVYDANRERARSWAGNGAQAYSDFRRVLERKDLDAVLVATPDHWHAIITMLACESGKHVYTEKPLAYSVREGRAMVTAARRYKRVVQAGTQHRSAPHFAELAQLVRGGGLGAIAFVRVWNYVNIFPGGIGHAADGPAPPGLDWDFWLGPAPKVPYNPLRCLTTFRFFRDYAGGTITDFGTHRFDTVHQIMGPDKPKSVMAVGGRFVLKDDGDVPDTMQVIYEYPGWVLSYECSSINGHGLGGRTPGMRYYNARGADDRPHGMAFYGTKGTLIADRIGYDLYPPDPRYGFGGVKTPSQPIGGAPRKWMNTTDATAAHTRNFVDAIRTGAPPACDVETGHRATLVAHLGNIALRAGRKLEWDSETESFPGQPDANAMLYREPRRPWSIPG